MKVVNMMQKVMMHNNEREKPNEIKEAMEWMIQNGYHIDHIVAYGKTMFVVYSKKDN